MSIPTEADFNAYKEVQQSGEYNMYDPNARMVTGLDKNTYISVMEHYSELEEKYGDE